MTHQIHFDLLVLWHSYKCLIINKKTDSDKQIQDKKKQDTPDIY